MSQASVYGVSLTGAAQGAAADVSRETLRWARRRSELDKDGDEAIEFGGVLGSTRGDQGPGTT